jgi:ketosteroid isomerase-like protein
MLSLFCNSTFIIFTYLVFMVKRFSAILIFTTIIFLSSCDLKNNAPVSTGENARENLIKADKAFSDMSAEKGMKNAFLEYIDSNAVLLRPNAFPIAGADAVDYLIATNDTGYTMTWQPKNAAVAVSGEMGYTYGTYILKPQQKDTALYGTYVSIWKKDMSGKWKLMLDSGNEGIGMDENPE